MIGSLVSPQPWQEVFIGVSALLGEPLEETLAALERATSSEWGGPDASAGLTTALRSPSRLARAEGIALALTAVAVDLDGMRLR